MHRKRARLVHMRLLIASILLLVLGCSSAILPKENGPTDYKSCVAAGFPVIETDPSQCFAPDEVFEAPPKIVKSLEQKQPDEAKESITPSGAAGNANASLPTDVAPGPAPESCKNMCGDGVCQQIVCEGTDCPCAEDPVNCTKDCVVHP